LTFAEFITQAPLPLIWGPIAVGLLVAVLPRKLAIGAKVIAVLVTALAAAGAVGFWIDRAGSQDLFLIRMPQWALAASWEGRKLFAADALSLFAAAAAGVLAFLMTLYAVGFSKEEDAPARRLYSGILLTLGATFGSIYAENLMVLAAFWGFLGIPFFLLLALGRKRDEAVGAAKKALIIVGGADALLIMGIALFGWALKDAGGRLAIHGARVSTANGVAAFAYVCFLTAALAKAGAIPLHSWIPGASAAAPVPVVALLPAALDKVLGIYLLARISLVMFDPSGWVSGLVMSIGAVTVIAAVFMALVQHDLKKLLGFHAVSQVGYMVLGIGTGTFIGVAGGLFHMLNNTVYKSLLFLSAGTAERKAGTSDLGKLGGLAKALPVSFVAALIAALAISGIPPLNGFASKWMVYQGLVEIGKPQGAGGLWIILLAAAMFGSALTLASFVKVIYGVYLGPRPADEGEPTGKGENVFTILPMAVLAIACVVFGVAAYALPLERAVYPAVEAQGVARTTLSIWSPGIATVLILVGIVAGFMIYLLGTATKPRVDASYTGGEVAPDLQFKGTDYYETVTRIPPLTSVYERASKGMYDLYRWGVDLASYAGRVLSAAHEGQLHRYVTWMLLGVVLLLWAFLKKTG